MFFREISDDLAVHFETEIYNRMTYNTPILYGRLNRWGFRKGIHDVLRRNDVCFFEWASDLLEPASKMPKSVPIITRLHSFELFDWATKINWGNIDKIILISQAMQNNFIAHYPDQANKTVVIYNAIPVNKFQPINREFNFSMGMLCAINPIKRIYEVILVTKELVEMGYQPLLHLAGGRTHADKLDRYYVAVQRLIERLELGDAVKLYGQVDNPAEWLQNIDIFISNSYWEGMQTALLEAMATGCYCLAHFWDGVEEALPPANIYITDSELKQKIIKYSTLSANEKKFQRNLMREIAENKFNLQNSIYEIKKEINSLL